MIEVSCGFIAAVAVLSIFLYFDIVRPRQRANGEFLPSFIHPLYSCVMRHIEPYIACDFAKFIKKDTIKQLEHICKNKDDTNFEYKKFIDMASDNDFSYHFAFLQIYNALSNYRSILTPAKEECELRDFLGKKITKIILEEYEEMDDVLWEYFGFDKTVLINHIRKEIV